MRTSTYWRYRFNTMKASIVRDGQLGVNTLEARKKAILGTARPFNAVEEHEHGLLAEQANTQNDVEERAHDLEQQSKKVAWHTKRWVLIPGLVLVFVAEALSCIATLAALGVEMPDRLFFGIGLTAGIFLAAFATIFFASHKQQEVPA